MLYKNGLGGTFYNPCYNQEEKGKDQKLKGILTTYGLGIISLGYKRLFQNKNI